MSQPASSLRVAAWDRWAGGFVEAVPPLLSALARAETGMLEERLPDFKERPAPVYITGLARAGTSILHHALLELPEMGSYRVRDFPFVLTPWFNDQIQRFALKKDVLPVERSHGDRVTVTPNSPEALEELLWKHYHRHLWDGPTMPVLSEALLEEAFPEAYCEAVNKLLYVVGKERFLAKNNYLLPRLELLPGVVGRDVFAVICTREPLAHVASLLKQHHRFTEAAAHQPEVARQLCRLGHYEFGPFARPIAYPGAPDLSETFAALAAGEMVRYYALQWRDAANRSADIYDDSPPGVSVSLVRFEDLCARSNSELQRLLEEIEREPWDGPAGGSESEEDTDLDAELPEDDSDAEPEDAEGRDAIFIKAWLKRWSEKLTPPKYYQSSLSEADRRLVREITGEAAKRLGYRGLSA
ncbi:MAG: hypothetical protein ACFB21_11955 [Opitutales bacterium]